MLIASLAITAITPLLLITKSLLTMSSATYSIEHAKSGRSSCKKCKIKIEKGELRLGKLAPGAGDFDMQSWFHPGCMPFPKQLKREGVTVESFVTDILEDKTDEHILKEKPEEVIAMMSNKPKTPKKVESKDVKVAKIKARIEEQAQDEPPKKKQKSLTDEEEGEMEVYGIYAEKTGDELKDILRWNMQPVSGSKSLLLLRVIDGHMHGRIGWCKSCQNGRLKIEDESGEKIVCSGYFDEETQMRVPCEYSGKLSDAPRLQPWFTQEPTEEEVEEMEAAKRGDDPEVAHDTSELANRAEKLDWDLGSKEGIQKATADLIELFSTGDGPKVDIPEDPQKAKMAVGKIVVANKSSDAKKVVKLVVEKFGLSKQNVEKAEKKSKAAEESCAVPANAPILEVITELRSLYFAEGNRNAGATYSKAATAILNLDFEITEENAKKLGKPGKFKVDGIGKGTAEKIHEFITTGKIEKLEEKRASAE